MYTIHRSNLYHFPIPIDKSFFYTWEWQNGFLPLYSFRAAPFFVEACKSGTGPLAEEVHVLSSLTDKVTYPFSSLKMRRLIILWLSQYSDDLTLSSSIPTNTRRPIV